MLIYSIRGFAASPATENLFDTDDTECLSNAAAVEFRSRVAKLLFLAIRVRPDILTAVAFLSTRVQVSNLGDMVKLDRVLKYLNSTQELGIVIEPSEGLQIVAYVDASYGVHADYKSHTGAVVSLGRGPVWTMSKKQKLVSKSSTEAELIGVSDALTQVIWIRDFLISQGYTVDAAKLFQDNTSTIAMIKRGSSNSDRTRHIAIRFFFVKDRVDAGEIKVEYMKTADMVADVLTKPLQGTYFRKLRAQLLNWGAV